MHDGTISGASWVAGVSGSALSFDGVDDSLSIPDSDDFDATTGMTFVAWASTAENKTAKILQKADWNGHGIYQDNWNGWKVHFRVNGASYSVNWGDGIPALGQWYHIAGIFDGSDVILYVDGVEKGRVAAAGSLTNNTNPVYMGADASQKFFNGRIDEAQIYEIALSSVQITNLFQSY